MDLPPADPQGTTTTLLMCRHGETEWNQIRKFTGSVDIALNEKGRQQGRLLASALESRGLTAVWTSPLIRAHATAKFIVDKCGVPLRLDERLRERHLGILQGQHYRDVAKHHPQIWNAWKSFTSLPPQAEAEPDEDVKERIESALFSISDVHPGGTVAVVGHAGTMRCLLKGNSGIVGNASITTIVVGPGRSWRAIEVDHEKHLPGPSLKLGDLSHPDMSQKLEGKPITTIMLCRHGESLGNISKIFQGTIDLPLSETGHLQARYIGNYLKPLGLTALWTSPQKRAQQTAEEVSALIGIPWHVDSRLSERDLGKLQGCLHEEVKRKLPEAWAAWKGYLPLPDEILAEPRPAVIARLESVLFEISEKYPGERVVVILHGANGRELLKRSIGNGSITTLQVGPGREWHVQQLGYAAHLPLEFAKDAIKASKL